jgi:hypothetical protein
MAKNRTKSKLKSAYLEKYRETRKIGAHNFNLDLRHIKADNQLTRTQKKKILAVYSDYSEIMEYHKNGAMKLIKPHKLRGETQTQYNKRFKRIQANETTLTNLSVIPLGVPAKSKYKIVNDRIVITRPNTDLKEFHYPLVGEDMLEFIKNPESIIDGVIAQHNKEFPKSPAILVGLGSDGYPWNIMGIKNIDKIVAAYEKMHGVYIAAGNKGITVSHIIIRAE